jgi:glycosyltransferase involved in cell wall biosynthesis
VNHLRILIAGRRNPYPFSYDGGAERSTAWLAKTLASIGHDVHTLGSYRGDELSAALDASSRVGCNWTQATDGSIGATHDGVHLRMVRRVAFEAACRKNLEDSRPDMVITQLEGSSIVTSLTIPRRVPTILRLVGPCNADTYPAINNDVLLVANSPLTAKIGADHYGRPIGFIITPVEKDVPRVNLAEPRYVTFVNPRRDKGLHLFARVAAKRPRLPFLVVMGWQNHPHESDEQEALAFLRQMPNVTFRKGTVRMSEVYGCTRTLLVPSRWPESWPRVVGEAQAHGIPVLGSAVGCVPHAVGPGGVVLPYGDPDLWCRVLDHVYGDASFRAELSRGARDSVMRFQGENSIRRWTEAIEASLRCEPWSGRETDTVPFLRAAWDEEGQLRFRHDCVGLGDSIDYKEPEHA